MAAESVRQLCWYPGCICCAICEEIGWRAFKCWINDTQSSVLLRWILNDAMVGISRKPSMGSISAAGLSIYLFTKQKKLLLIVFSVANVRKYSTKCANAFLMMPMFAYLLIPSSFPHFCWSPFPVFDRRRDCFQDVTTYPHMQTPSRQVKMGAAVCNEEIQGYSLSGATTGAIRNGAQFTS